MYVCARSLQFTSATQDCMHCSPPGFSVHHHILELAQTHVYPVSNAIQHLIFCLFLLLPSIFPNIRVFSNESVFPIRWPKYWRLSFNISPSNKYSGLTSFRIDWLQPMGLLRDFFNITVQKHQFFSVQVSLWSDFHIQT